MQGGLASVEKRRADKAKKPEDGQAKVHKLDAVRDRLAHLKQLHRAKSETATDYAEAIEAVATAAGVDKGALAAFVAAAAGDKVQVKRERARQLALLFEEIGA